MVPNPKFQVFKGSGGKEYFRLNAKNGQQILRPGSISPGYSINIRHKSLPRANSMIPSRRNIPA